jgi:hypothetical protein
MRRSSPALAAPRGASCAAAGGIDCARTFESFPYTIVSARPTRGPRLDSWDALELPTYRALAVLAEPFNRGEVTEYSDGLLQWCKANNPTISSWAKATRIVFALTITSAASERVFSLVKSMYGTRAMILRLQMSSRAQ